MLSRLYPDPSTEEEKAEMGKLMRAVAHNYPDVLPEMQLNVRQLRRAAAKYAGENTREDLCRYPCGFSRGAACQCGRRELF